MVSLKCKRCCGLIQRDELYIQLTGGDDTTTNSYHYECFACDACERRLQPGDEYMTIGDEQRLYCKQHALHITNSGIEDHHHHQQQRQQQLHQQHSIFIASCNMAHTPSDPFSPSISSSSSSSMVDSPLAITATSSASSFSSSSSRFVFTHGSSTSSTVSTADAITPNHLPPTYQQLAFPRHQHLSAMSSSTSSASSSTSSAAQKLIDLDRVVVDKEGEICFVLNLLLLFFVRPNSYHTHTPTSESVECVSRVNLRVLQVKTRNIMRLLLSLVFFKLSVALVSLTTVQ